MKCILFKFRCMFTTVSMKTICFIKSYWLSTVDAIRSRFIQKKWLLNFNSLKTKFMSCISAWRNCWINEGSKHDLINTVHRIKNLEPHYLQEMCPNKYSVLDLTFPTRCIWLQILNFFFQYTKIRNKHKSSFVHSVISECNLSPLKAR